jgi:hypothetical protein
MDDSNGQPLGRNILTKVRIYHDPWPRPGRWGHARVAVLHPFLNFSIDAPMLNLFKLIDLFIELLTWY